MSNLNSLVFYDEEFHKEINYQLELASNLTLANLVETSLPHNETDNENLLILCQSLIKLSKNEIFLHYFKTNQVNRARNIKIFVFLNFYFILDRLPSCF
jgi:hypothetical protein